MACRLMTFINYQEKNEWCYKRWFSEINKDYFTYAQIIRDLIIMKENRCTRLFSNNDCNFIMDYLCII